MIYSHRNYLTFLVKSLRKTTSIHPSFSLRISEHADLLILFSMLNLEPAQETLNSCYRPSHGGKTPRCPVAMFRSILLMAICDVTSFNKWAAHLKTHPELSIIAGFEPHHPPSASSFYDFMWRLLDGPYQKSCSHHQPRSSRYRGVRNRFRRQLKHEKTTRNDEKQKRLDEHGEQAVQQTVRLALENLENAIPTDFTNLLEELLMACAVVPSALNGTLGNITRLSVAGDASVLPSQAKGWGTPMCDCRKNGVFACECERLYADPDATWGWDSYEEKFVFGYKLHALVTTVGQRDVPLQLMLKPAHTSDAIMGVEASTRLHKLLQKHLPDARMTHGIFDAGYDAKAFYRLLMQLQMTPIIPLSRGTMTPHDIEEIALDKDGTPLCPGGAPMRWHGFNKRQESNTYNCPAKRPGKTNGKADWKVRMEHCPLGTLCETKSKMGPLYHLDVGTDPRLHLPIPRGHKRFKELYNKRTCTERFFATVTEYGGLSKRPYRRQHIFAIRALAHGILAHAKAWVKRRFGWGKKWKVDELFEVIETLRNELE